MTNRPLVLFAVILVVLVAIVSIAATVIVLVRHVRSNKNWAERMSESSELLGRANMNASLALELFGNPGDQLREVVARIKTEDIILGRPEDEDKDLERKLSDFTEAMNTLLAGVDRFLAGLDEMPLLAFATIEKHPDTISELLQKVGLLRQLEHHVQRNRSHRG